MKIVDALNARMVIIQINNQANVINVYILALSVHLKLIVNNVSKINIYYMIILVKDVSRDVMNAIKMAALNAIKNFISKTIIVYYALNIL